MKRRMCKYAGSLACHFRNSLTVSGSVKSGTTVEHQSTAAQKIGRVFTYARPILFSFLKLKLFQCLLLGTLGTSLSPSRSFLGQLGVMSCKPDISHDIVQFRKRQRFNVLGNGMIEEYVAIDWSNQFFLD